MSNEFKRKINAHYISKFILKQFTIPNSKSVYYCSVKEIKCLDYTVREIDTPKMKKTKKVFTDINLYDNFLLKNPRQLEDDFGLFECEISKLLNENVFNKKEIKLTIQEEEALKIFFFLMKYRSLKRKKYFEKIDDVDKSYFERNCSYKDYVALWKDCLSSLTKCRRLDEILNQNALPRPIKNELLGDIFGAEGTYLTFIKRKGVVEFVISDLYPFIYEEERVLYPFIYYFPLSPDLMMASFHKKAYKDGLLKGINHKITPPIYRNNEIIYTLQEFDENEVKARNNFVFNKAKAGVCFRDIKTFSYADNSCLRKILMD